MVNGRPAPNSYKTTFYPKDMTLAVDSLTNKTDVSGWTLFTGLFNIQNNADGLGKKWEQSGNVYIGQWKNNNATDGKNYVLQADGTHTLYELVNNIRVKEISKGHRLRQK